MAINYTWSVFEMQKRNTENLSDVIQKVSWVRVGIDDTDGVQGTMVGSSNLDISNLDPNNFVAFSNLTEQQVGAWLETVEAEHLAYYNSIIEQEISNKRSVVTVRKDELPWNPPSQ
jgi:hypothetical protein